MEDKVLNKLDAFVLDFMKILESQVEYVVVSGYVAILFGRSRGTEDIDVLMDPLGREDFGALYRKLRSKGYDFLNPEDEQGLYEMLEEGLAIRAAECGRVIPNVELKFCKDDFDRYSLDRRVEVIVGGGHVYISPFELQIPYKIWLGSDKDIEDAVFLWELFKDRVDKRKMEELMLNLKVEGKDYGIGL